MEQLKIKRWNYRIFDKLEHLKMGMMNIKGKAQRGDHEMLMRWDETRVFTRMSLVMVEQNPSSYFSKQKDVSSHLVFEII